MMGEYGAACGWFAQGLSFDLNPALEYVIDMVETYGYALINSGQEQTALFFENIYDEFGKSADFQFLMGLIYMKNARFTGAVREFEKAVGHAECRAQGVNSYRADYNIGVIYECLGKKREEALAYYRKCGGYAPAEERIRELGREVEEKAMTTREEALEYGMSFPDVYVDTPFHDSNWVLVRSRKISWAFLWTYEYQGQMRINVKADPGGLISGGKRTKQSFRVIIRTKSTGIRSSLTAVCRMEK